MYEEWKESTHFKENLMVLYQEVITAFKELFNENILKSVNLFGNIFSRVSSNKYFHNILLHAVSLFHSSICTCNVTLTITKYILVL